MRPALVVILLVVAGFSIYQAFKNVGYSGESQYTPVDQRVNLLLAGDVMLGRTVNIKSLEANNPQYPFEKVAERLSKADIVFVNLESPIVENCPKINSGFKFCADPKMVDGLKYAGVDIVTLANNHIMNFGNRGLEDTKKNLVAAGIKWVGRGNFEVIEKQGTKFGFLGFEWVDKGPTKEDLELIKNNDPKVDILVVAPHWGWEYRAIANNNQRTWAKMAIEQGADVVVGSHPHWVQDDEKVLDKPVYYSLGNFVFDQMWSENTKKGMAVELIYEDNKLINETRLPIYMQEWAQPEWVSSNN